MITFEITIKGFDGSTDKNDHLVKWINATSLDSLNRWLEENDILQHLSEEPLAIAGESTSWQYPRELSQEDGVDFVVMESDENWHLTPEQKKCIIQSSRE